MTTNNIISTPDITGNVGSCTTQTVKAESSRLSSWKIQETTIATNGCTGQVTTYQTWSYTTSAFVGLVGSFVLALMIIGLIKIWLTPADNRNPYNYL